MILSRAFMCSSEGSWNLKVFVLLKFYVFYFDVSICEYSDAVKS